MKRFIFVTRTWDFIQKNDKEELKFPDLKELQEQWGPNYQVLTLDDKGLFNLTAGDQLYVMGGHGKPASDVVFWGKEDNTENHLTAKTVAEYTVERFPTCYRAQTGTAEKAFWESKVIKLDKDKLPHKDYKIKSTSKNPAPGVLIKVYSCHSGEGGFNSFANQFAQEFAKAYRPTGDTYEVTFFGYTGKITPKPSTLNKYNVENSKNFAKTREQYPSQNIPADYTGPKASVVAGQEHHWSKVSSVFHSRASEAREEVARLKTVKGSEPTFNAY